MRWPITGGLVAALLVAGAAMATSARADNTVIEDSPDQWDEPNLTGVNPFPDNPNPSVLETLYGEENLRRVDDAFDLAFRHTGDVASARAVAHFDSGGAGFGYLPNRMEPLEEVLFVSSPLGGYNPQTQGTGIIELADSGPVFEFYLANVLRTSNPVKNPFGLDLLVTFEIVDNAGHTENPVGSFVLAWEARYSADSDRDFQDFVFEISRVAPVPEPGTAVLVAFFLRPLMLRFSTERGVRAPGARSRRI